MARRNMNTKKSTYSIPKPLLERLEEYSDSAGLNKSVIMAMALKDYLKKEERKCRK